MLSKAFCNLFLRIKVHKIIDNNFKLLSNPTKATTVWIGSNCVRKMSSKTYRGIKVFKLSANFDEATKIVDIPLKEPSADEVLIKNIYVGINATDLNVTAGRYFAHDPVPYPIGIEVTINSFI